MERSLQIESENLARSWMQHDQAKLRDYLVAGVEDPRINIQSIFSRHFLTRALFGERFEPLMLAECRFSAAMNWLRRLMSMPRLAEEIDAVIHALNRGADNAEGIEIPLFVLQAFAGLPESAGELSVPNYISAYLAEARSGSGAAQSDLPSLDTFRHLWQRVLLGQAAVSSEPANAFQVDPAKPSSTPRVLEPACGSANDYRFIHRYGLARFVDYTGVDLCARNIDNARVLFPQIRFEEGNVFELAAPDKSFDYTFTHDLFEHLSPGGLEVAIEQICRVTARGICVGFFNMDEIRDHIIQPLDEYHWNRLSMPRTRELFAQHGFSGQVYHIGSFLRQLFGCEETHNPNAYTFVLHAAGAGSKCSK